jgi:dCMP deaminase
MRPLIIGLTGPNAAGKGEVAEILRRRGFACHSLSDVVREEAARRGLPPTREHLIRIGNELRLRHGAGILARRIGARLAGCDVVDSIRNPSEVQTLRRRRGFVLVGVVAPRRLRYRRALRRARPGDPLTLREFTDKERRENSSSRHAQQLAATLALADLRVSNAGSLDELRRRVERLLGRLRTGGGSGGRTGGASARRPRSRRYGRTRRPRAHSPRRRRAGKRTTPRGR